MAPPEAPTASVSSKALAGYSTRDLFGHKQRICTLAWSSSGRKLASGSSDQGIRVWTVEPHSQVSRPERSDLELRGHTGTVSHVSWKPGSDSVLASTTAGDKSDKSIRLWDVKSGKNTGTVTTSTGNVCITWSPDGSSLAAINTDNTLSLVDVRKAKVIKTHRFSQDTYDVMWGPSLQQLMASTDQGSVDVLGLPHMEPLWSLKGHCASAYCFALSRNSKYMASGGGDAIIALWDLDDMVCVRTWAHVDHPVRSISLSHDASLLAYASEQGEAEVLAAQTGERLADLKIRAKYSDCVAWCPTANVLAYCDEAPDPSAARGDHRAPMLGVVTLYAPPKPS